MANKRVTELDSLFSVATGDLFYVVDISDLTMSEAGSSKKVAFSDLVAPLASIYASTSYVNGASGALSTRIDAINAGTGNFVVTSALSSYVQTSQTGAFLTASSLTPYATTTYVNNVSGAIDTRLDFLEGATGSYVRNTQTGSFLTTTAAASTYYTVTSGAATETKVSQLQGQTGLYTLNSQTGALATSASVTAIGTRVTTLEGQTGNYVRTTQTGSFLTASALTPYATTTYVNNVSGAIDTRLDVLEGQTGSFATSSSVSTLGTRVGTLEGQTGSYVYTSQTGQFASDADVLGLSGYLVQQIGASSAGVSSLNGGSGVLTLNGLGLVSVARNGQDINISGASPDLSAYATTANLQTTGSTLSTRIGTLEGQTGTYVRTSQTGAFLTSASLTSYATQSYVNTASGALDTKITNVSNRVTTLEGQTGSYALSSQTGNFATTFLVSTSSGALDGKITTVSNRVTTLEGQTGSFVQTSQTGQFASDADVLGLSGYLIQQIGASSAGVSSLNGGSGVLTLNGLGLVSVNRNGQNIDISGASPDLSSYATTASLNNYALKSETGAFLTSSALTPYATTTYVNNVSGAINTRVSTLEGQTGSFALSSTVSSTYYTISSGNALATRVGTLEGQTGNYVRTTQTGSFVTTAQTGVLASAASVTAVSNRVTTLEGQTGSYALASQTGSFATVSYVNSVSGANSTRITTLEGQTGNYVRTSQTGSFVTTSQTGVFLTTSAAAAAYYPLSSGQSDVTRITTLEGQTGTYVRSSQTGTFLTTSAAASTYYPLTSGQSDVTRITTLESRTGSYVLQSQTGGFATSASVAAGYYPLASGNALNAATGNYVLRSETGALATSAAVASTYYTITSGAATESRVTSLESKTGLYYLNTNPNGYITNSALAPYAAADSGISGRLNTLESKTGQYLTGVRAGTNVTVANNGDGTYTINSAAAGGSAYTGQYINFDIGSNIALNSGFAQQFIPFSAPFTVAPKVWAQISNSAGDPILAQYISGTATSGFTAVFSDTIRTTNYKLSYWATTGNGYNLLGAGMVSGDFATTSQLNNYYPLTSGQADRTDINLLKSQTGNFVLRSETGAFGGGGGGGTGTTAPSGVNQQKSISLMLPQSGDNLTLFYTRNEIFLSRASTILVNSSGAGRVDWNIKYSNTRNSAGSNLISTDFSTISQDFAQQQVLFTSSVPADNFVWLSVSSISGTVDQFHLTLDYI